MHDENNPPAELEVTPRRDVLTVSRLTAEVRSVLSSSFPLLWVEGEISGLSRPRSGHVYFALKDAHCQVRCVLFRMRRQLLRFDPADGDRVLVRARVSFYEPRGEFQLTIESMAPAGAGELQRQFEELRTRLAAEGLFDAALKRPLPAWPRHLGLITSPSGAALHDVLSVLARRAPGLGVRIYPAQMQGDGAPAQVMAALAAANRRADCDLLLVTRGGGATEDLACFNDEALARAVRASRIPVISAIGHEIDFTIADFVADLRAATPSAAAETLSRDWVMATDRLEQFDRRARAALDAHLRHRRQRMDQLQLRLERHSPQLRLQQLWQRLDRLESRLLRTLEQRVNRRAQRLRELSQRLALQHPRRWLRLRGERLEAVVRRLTRAMAQGRERRELQLVALAGRLHALSPLATLARGYSITCDDQGQVVQDADATLLGQRLITRLHRGELVSRVESISADRAKS